MNTRTVVKPSHVKAGCPICLNAIEVDYAEALQERLLREQQRVNDRDSMTLDLDLLCAPS